MTKSTIHNANLCVGFISKSRVFSRYPKVIEQLECVPFDASKLHPNAYNPSIIRHQGRVIMAYRWQTKAGEQTKIALAVLDDNLTVESVHELKVAETSDLFSMEDPKLFELAGVLHIAWVSSKWPKQMNAVVRYAPCPLP